MPAPKKNRNAAKGAVNRKLWTARLPEDVIKIIQIEAGESKKSQADFVSMLVRQYNNANQADGQSGGVSAAKMFYVVSWETKEVLSEHPKLALAKRYARGEGHTGEDHPQLTGYPPVAYVANEAGECVYNPRFGKRIRSDVGGLINAQPANHF